MTGQLARTTRRHLPRGAKSTMVVVAVGLMIGGAAHAYWGGSGAGSGSASTATTLGLTVAPGTTTTMVYPGAESDVALDVSNPNPAAIHIGSLQLDVGSANGGFGVDAAHAACALSTLSYTTQTNGGAGWTVPAGGSVSLVLPDALAMGIDAENACQGGTFSIYLTVQP